MTWYKELRTLFSITIFVLAITGCGRINPFAKIITTSMSVEVQNQSTSEITASGAIYERSSSDECDRSQTSSAQSVLIPGDRVLISLSVKCLDHARTSVSVVKSEPYNLASISIRDAAVAAKLIAGLQFSVTNSDHTNPVSIQVVSSPVLSGNYNYFWPLAPNDALNVAWLVPQVSQSGTPPWWKLFISLDSATTGQMLSVEFDDSTGIERFGDYQIEHVNGVYRSHLGAAMRPTIYSGIAGGFLACNDVGCTENR